MSALIFALLEEGNYEAAVKLVSVKPATAALTEAQSGLPVIFLCLPHEHLSLLVLKHAQDTARVVHPGKLVPPLHLACSQSSAKVVAKLLSLYPEAVEMNDSDGNDSLYYACQNRNTKETMAIFELLLPPVVAPQPRSGHGSISRANPAVTAARVSRIVAAAPSSVPTPPPFVPSNKVTAMHHAAAAGNRPEVLAVLMARMPHDVQTPLETNGWLPLHSACAGDAPVDCLEALCSAYPVALLTRDASGALPVSIAARRGMSAQGIRFMVESTRTYADLAKAAAAATAAEASDAEGTTPHQKSTEGAAFMKQDESELLHLMIDQGASLETMKALMEVVADAPLLLNSQGDSPLVTALLHTPFNEAVVDLLLIACPECTLCARSLDGSYPVHVALEHAWPAAFVRKLLKAGPKASRRANGDGKLPLHFACWKRAALDVTMLLLEMFPEGIWEKEDKYGMNALMYVAAYGRNEKNGATNKLACDGSTETAVARHIISLDEHVIHEVNHDKRTALHLAVLGGACLPLVQTLFDAAPSHLSSIDTRGWTPVQYALELRKEAGAPGDVVRFLLSKRAQVTDAPVELVSGEAGVVVTLTDFERSAQEYEMRCRMEELEKNKTNRRDVQYQLMDRAANARGTAGGDGGAEDRTELLRLRKKLNAQAVELRQLHGKAHGTLDAVSLHNQIVALEAQLREKDADMKEMRSKLITREKEVIQLTEDCRLLRTQIKTPADTADQERRMKSEMSEQHHQSELIRSLRHASDSSKQYISDLNLEIKQLKDQLKGEVAYVKEKEKEVSREKARAEQLMSEIEELRVFKRAIQKGSK